MSSVAFAMVAANDNIYFGLWYPVTFLAVAVPVSALHPPEIHNRELNLCLRDGVSCAASVPSCVPVGGKQRVEGYG